MEPAKHSSWASAGVRSCESSTTRSGRRPRISSSGSRTVSIGSSASTVPLPVTTAEARARSRCTSARARSPVIHLLVPSASAVRPSRLAPSLRVTHGRPVSMRRTKPRLISAASPASRPWAVAMPACSSRARPEPSTRGLGSRIAHDDAPHARRDQRLGARRRASRGASRARASRRPWRRGPHRRPRAARRPRRAARRCGGGSPPPRPAPSAPARSPRSGSAASSSAPGGRARAPAPCGGDRRR